MTFTFLAWKTSASPDAILDKASQILETERRINRVSQIKFEISKFISKSMKAVMTAMFFDVLKSFLFALSALPFDIL